MSGAGTTGGGSAGAGGPRDSVHLDDEALSAALDGEATPGEIAHLAACEECGRRRDELGAVSRAVAGATVAARPVDAVDAAVAAALAARGSADAAVAAALAAQGSAADPDAATAAGHAGAVPAASPAESGAQSAPDDGPDRFGAGVRPGRGGAGRRPRTWRDRLVSGPAAAAAVIVVLVAGVGFAISSAGGRGPSTTADRTASSPHAHTKTAGGSAPAAPPSPSSFAPADALGTFSRPLDLEAALEVRLSRPPTATAGAAQPTPLTTPPTPTASCGAVIAASAAQAGGGPAVLAAPLSYQGHPAEVGVYRQGVGHLAVVVDTGGCTVVAVLHF
ncbi:MAG TPA: hypothetical protein VG184_09555 [Acidimicrobiales bacterium]|nr:hypothetical protein [Acidimicrobiales bacterium]